MAKQVPKTRAVIFKSTGRRVVFHPNKKGTGIAARKRFTKAKAAGILKGLDRMPTKRAGKRGGMTTAMKAKARRTIKRKFKTL